MPRSNRVTGTRVSLTIPPDLAKRLVGHPTVAREMTRVVAEIASGADASCPVGETGQLKKSQESDVLITPAGVVGIVAYTEFYAHMVHNGTATMPPNPWLLNAALSVLVASQKPAIAAAVA